MAPWGWFLCKPKHVAAVSIILICFNNSTFFTLCALVEITKCLQLDITNLFEKVKWTDLVYIGILLGVCEDIKGCVELIEQAYDLHCAPWVSISGAVVAETHNSGKQERHAVIAPGRHWALVTQFIGDADRQYRVEQSVGVRDVSCLAELLLMN